MMEESILKFLEQKAQENASSSILKPKSFFWDSIIFSLAYAIVVASISGIIVDFIKSDENSVACFSPFENEAQYTYINSYCYKHLPREEFFPLLLVAQAAVLIAPHYVWKVIFSTQFDSFFSHAARVQILRERNTGKYPLKNYTIVNYLQREFAYRKYILAVYLTKLAFQLALVIFMITVNAIWFTKIDSYIMFECSDDEEYKYVFGNVTCANPRKLFINILKVTDYVLLSLALLAVAFGLFWCIVLCRSTGDYEKTAEICYKSCIDPQYYYKVSIRWLKMNNDFAFLLASLHFGYRRVFKTILIEKLISQTYDNDLKKLAQSNYVVIVMYDSVTNNNFSYYLQHQPVHKWKGKMEEIQNKVLRSR